MSQLSQLALHAYLSIALMPEFIASYNGLRSPLARVNELAQAIRENGDDIICLQEGL